MNTLRRTGTVCAVAACMAMVGASVMAGSKRRVTQDFRFRDISRAGNLGTSHYWPAQYKISTKDGKVQLKGETDGSNVTNGGIRNGSGEKYKEKNLPGPDFSEPAWLNIKRYQVDADDDDDEHDERAKVRGKGTP